MILAYHGATHMTSGLETDLRVTAQAGFKGIELWATKIDDYLEKHSISDLRKLFKTYNVEASSINSIEFIAFRGKDFKKIKMRCEQLSFIAGYINCPFIVVVPSPTSYALTAKSSELSPPWEKVIDEYVKVLRVLSDIAKPHGVSLAFEFIGFGWCSVRTPRACYEIVKAVNRKNVGLNFDACHFYAGGGELDEIKALDPKRIITFHINDLEDVPKEQISDSRRLLPGKGIVPLDRICKALKDIKYDGLCSIEIFRDEYWKWDPLKLAKQARKSSLEILSKYFKVE